MRNDISVLMSIYSGEKVDYFDAAMDSIWTNQTLKPAQVVLVIDGPVSLNVGQAIDKWKERLGSKLTLKKLEENVGLGAALQVGLAECRFEYVARMDTDDIAMPRRLQEQVGFLIEHNKIDVVGTYISEIDEYGATTREVVNYPLIHSEMLKMFAKRDPLPHVTAMFRKSFFKKAGSYSNELKMAEDTHLWYKGFMSGCTFANIPMIGVRVRQSQAFYKRRGDVVKTLALFRFRIKKINRDLHFGLKADVYALCYLLMSFSPAFAKKILYRVLR